MDLEEMLCVDRCRDMEELINFWMPEPDYFLRYRMHCNARNYITSGKSYVQVLSMVIRRPSQQRRVVLRRRNTVVGGKCALPSAVLVLTFVM